MTCSIYILRSCEGDRYYVGSAEDVEQRIREHNGPGAKWTKRYQPWVLVHSETFVTRGEAVARERELKRLKGIAKHLDAIRRGEL